MKLTIQDKLKRFKEHIIEGKMLLKLQFLQTLFRSIGNEKYLHKVLTEKK